MYLETTSLGTIKIFGYGTVILIFQYLAIPGTQLVILGVLMLMDLITGIAKQYSVDRKEITSHKMWLGSLKKLITIICVFAIALMLASFDLPAIDRQTYLNMILSLFIVNETYSIIGNTYTVRTGKEIKEYDAISLVLKKIGDLVYDFLKSKTK